MLATKRIQQIMQLQGVHTCSEDIETAHLVAGRVTDCTPARGAVKALAEAVKQTTTAAAFIVALCCCCGGSYKNRIRIRTGLCLSSTGPPSTTSACAYVSRRNNSTTARSLSRQAAHSLIAASTKRDWNRLSFYKSCFACVWRLRLVRLQQEHIALLLREC
jgi:hypothetical protein